MGLRHEIQIHKTNIFATPARAASSAATAASAAVSGSPPEAIASAAAAPAAATDALVAPGKLAAIQTSQ